MKVDIGEVWVHGHPYRTSFSLTQSL